MFTKESESARSRWTKNLAKIGFGGVIGAVTSAASAPVGAVWGAAEGTSYARTAATNREFARKILEVAKGKTEAQEAAELLKKMKKAAQKRGDTTFDDDDDDTPATPETPPVVPLVVT